MNDKIAPRMMLALLFIIIVTWSHDIPLVKASGTVYLRPDGSIDPVTAPIQRDGYVYTFTDNVNDSIVVERDNITVDGNGYTLQGSGRGDGFSLSCVNNVTIKNTNIKGFFRGIYLNSTWNNVISRNNITNNGHSGIQIRSSSNNTLSGNNLAHNFYAFSSYSSSQNIVSVNKIVNNKDGIFLDTSSNNTISENDISNNLRRGVVLFSCWNNVVSMNRIVNNTNFGIRLYQSSNNKFSRNNLVHNIYGVWLFLSSYNNFCHNNFINNTHQVYAKYGYANSWDDDYPSGGNYWSDYVGNDTYSGSYQNETGNDWIGDTPCIIDESNQDNYPLTEPYVPETEEIWIAYRNLLLRYSQMHSDLAVLNSTVHNLFGIIMDFQERYDLLLTVVNNLQEQIDLLNSTLQISVDELQGQIDSLNSSLTSGQEAVINELIYIRNIMYLFVAMTIILIATTIYLATRKPKIKP